MWLAAAASHISRHPSHTRVLTTTRNNVSRLLTDTYVHVRYMLSAVRLLSVCRLSVTLVRPTQPVEIFGNFFHRTIAQWL